MYDPEITTLSRDARRRRRLPPDAACATCGGREHLRRLKDGRVLCYADIRAEGGAVPDEADHPAGRANLGGLVVHLRANDHRTVTEIRLRLGIDGWPPAEGDPLLTCAHLIAGLATLLLLVAETLVDLAHHAADRFGPSPWDGARPAPVIP